MNRKKHKTILRRILRILSVILCIGMVACAKSETDKDKEANCSADGCEESVYKNGYCPDHYVENEWNRLTADLTKTPTEKLPEPTKTPEVTATPELTEAPTATPTPWVEDFPVDIDTSVQVEENVVYEEGDIKVTVKELIFEPYNTKLKVLIENNSSKTIIATTTDNSVNGYMNEVCFSSEVASGKKKNDYIIFDNHSLSKYGTKTIGVLSFVLNFYDPETYDIVALSEMIEVKTSAADSYKQNYDSSGDVIYDNEGIRVIAQQLVEDPYFGVGLNLFIENNSDRGVQVQSEYGAINGYMSNINFYCPVASGKKALGTIYISEEELALIGITEIGEIQLKLSILDSQVWDTIDESDTIVIPISDSYTQIYDDSGTEIYNNSGIRMVAKGMKYDETWGTQVIVYIENNSDQDVSIQTKESSVNGYSFDNYFFKDIIAGMKALTRIEISSSVLELNDITQITELETKFRIYNLYTWETITETDAITISFE